jgi:LysR family transcriptional regulator for bpeEF and oprC
VDHLLALRAFVRIAEAGSFAKAADSLNMPRSSVSKLLQDLELHLGTKLVERTTRAVTMTVEGLTYHERALRVLADIDEMDATVAGLQAAPRGRLRVDIGSVLANVILIPALGDFHNLYPDIELLLGVSDRPADLIEEGIDCVVRGGPLTDSTLKARRLCELDYVLCASRSYLKGQSIPSSPKDIEGHQVVSYFSASSGRRFPLRFHKGGEEIEHVPAAGIAVNESTAHLNSLLAGIGVGQTFGFLARPHFETGALVELMTDWKPANHLLHIVWPASRFTNPRLKVFADWVAGVFEAYDTRYRKVRPPPSSSIVSREVV